MPGRPDSVARIREPLPIIPGLCAIFGNRKAGELASISAEFCDPVQQRNSQHRLRVGGFRTGDESVAAFARHRACVADALKVPILRPVVGVLQPVVAARVISAIAIEWHVEVAQRRRARVCDAVNVRVDRMLIRRGINADRNCWILCQRGDCADPENNNYRSAASFLHGASLSSANTR